MADDRSLYDDINTDYIMDIVRDILVEKDDRNIFQIVNGNLQHITSVYISQYIKKEYMRALDLLSDDDYVICLIYKGRKKDWQIGITETCKALPKDTFRDVSYYTHTVKMGLAQELGIKVKSKKKIKCIGKRVINVKKKKTSYKKIIGIYNIPIIDTEPITEKDSKIMYDRKDDKSRKVACMIHGKLDDIVSVISKVKYYQEAKDSGNNVGFIKVKFLKEVINLIYTQDTINEFECIHYDKGIFTFPS